MSSGRNIFAGRKSENALSNIRNSQEVGSMIGQARRSGGLMAGWRIGRTADAHNVELVKATLEKFFEAKREELQYRIALGLDAAKKRAIADNLSDTGAIEREIAEMTAVLTNQMKNQVLDEARSAAIEETRRVRELEAMLSRGDITQRRFETEVRRIEEHTNAASDRCEAVANRVIENLGERLAAALRNVDREGR